MHSIPQDLETTRQKKGVVVLFNPSLKSERHPKPCIFCGKTIHVQTFKGKTVCGSCLHHIPALFICS